MRNSKKIVAALLTAIILQGTVIPITASAVTPQTNISNAIKTLDSEDIEKYFSYNVLDDGTLEITNYYGEYYGIMNVTIPSTINGRTVTKIANLAFRQRDSIVSITIPDTVTEIASYAFHLCNSLTSVTMSNNIKKIGTSAFSKCKSLTNINIPNTVTEIGVTAFIDCSSLKSITIPSGVTKIMDSTFSGCSSLTNVTIPNSVKEIGFSAFSNCTSLKNIKIPNGVEKIGMYAFSDCTSLTNISIPDSVTSIKSTAFIGSKSINVSSSNKYYSSKDGVLFNKDKTCLIEYPSRKSSTSYKIPNSVKEIECLAFEDCSLLNNVIIPNSVKKIGFGAFEDCVSLKSIKLPNSVTKLSNEVFQGCKSLTNITLSNKIETIYYSTFEECISLKSITIPDSVKEICEDAFTDCTSLTSIVIPKSVTNIKNYAIGYNHDHELMVNVLSGNFYINSVKNSAAETYANENRIKFKELCELRNDSTISATSINLGRSVTLTAKASGGTAPYKFYYYCKAPGSTKYVAMNTKNNASIRTTKPAVKGTYYYSVKVVDTKGNYKIKIFKVVVKDTPLTNNSTINSTNIKLGSSITLKAKAAGGTAPYKYYYYCKAPKATKYIAMNTKNTATNRTTKPTTKGIYRYSVKIVDAKGRYKTKVFTVNVK